MPSIRSRLIYKMMMRAGSPYDANFSLVQQRASIERMSKYSIMPPRVDIQPVSIGDMDAEWVRPHNVANDRALLYLHGGGYTMGSCQTHRALVARLAAASQVQALLIGYRLAPEYPFPAALEDAVAAYRWLPGQGIQSGKIFMAGDSAGGGLAVAASVFLRDAKEQLPAGIVCISPWADLTMSSETISTCAQSDPLISLQASLMHASLYVGQHDPASPLISPIFADLSQLPPLMIQVGEYETLQSDSVRLAEKARQAGVNVTLEIWDGMWHVWHMSAGLMPEAKQAIEKIGRFIQERVIP